MTFRSSASHLVILAVGVFTVGTDLFVLNGLLPTIAADLRVTESTAGQLTTIFAATYAVGTTFAVLAGARVVAAIGAAAFQANAFVVAGATASGENRGRALSWVAAGVSVSSVLGVPIGVFAGASVGWRGVMWGIAGIAVVVAVAVLALPRVTVPAAGLRTRLSVLVRPAVARVLVVSVFGVTASFSFFVYLPVVAADVAPGAMISWVLAASGFGSVAGNWLAGRWTDRVGPRRVRLVSIAGSAVLLAAMNAALPSLPGLLVAVVMTGAFSGMLMVPQQHRLFTLAPDAPTVALGLNGSAIFVGAGLGSALGGAALAAVGPSWLAPIAAVVALGAVALALENVTAREPEPV